MKITVEIDCTPAEARQFFGLPDLQPMQARMLADLERRMKVAMLNVSPESVANQWFGLWDINAMKTAWEKTLMSAKGTGEKGKA